MRRRSEFGGAVFVADPDLLALLGLADEDQTLGALVGQGELVGAGDGLLGLFGLEAHHRQLEALDEPVQVGHHAVVVLRQQRRRGDVARPDERGPVQEERDQPALVGESGQVAGDPQPVDGAHPEGHVLGQ